MKDHADDAHGVREERHVPDPRFQIGPMDRLYDLVFGTVENRYGAETRERLAAWLRSARPTLAHMAVMMTEMALSGTPMGERRLILVGFTPEGEPVIDLLQ